MAGSDDEELAPADELPTTAEVEPPETVEELDARALGAVINFWLVDLFRR